MGHRWGTLAPQASRVLASAVALICALPRSAISHHFCLSWPRCSSPHNRGKRTKITLLAMSIFRSQNIKAGPRMLCFKTMKKSILCIYRREEYAHTFNVHGVWADRLQIKVLMIIDVDGLYFHPCFFLLSPLCFGVVEWISHNFQHIRKVGGRNACYMLALQREWYSEINKQLCTAHHLFVCWALLGI